MLLRNQLAPTSSNLAQMSLKAEKMASVEPVTVTTRSGQDPSLMLILAPDCGTTGVVTTKKIYIFLN